MSVESPAALALETYRQSLGWRVRRALLAVELGGRCQWCVADGLPTDRSPHLAVHHMHYDTLGRESARDVRLLCGKCHAAFHFGLRRRYGAALQEFPAFTFRQPPASIDWPPLTATSTAARDQRSVSRSKPAKRTATTEHTPWLAMLGEDDDVFERMYLPYDDEPVRLNGECMVRRAAGRAVWMGLARRIDRARAQPKHRARPKARR